VGGCGCPVLINAKSDNAAAALTAYQAYQDAKCDVGIATCGIACPAVTGASCERQSGGPGSTFMCTGTSGLAK
jgi:hypothetical protein